jgi:hypothetical protein
MKIRTTGAAAVLPASKVKSVHEDKAEFKIEFEDGSSADPGSSVAVRDKNNIVEYLGRSDDQSLCRDPDSHVKKGREGKSGRLPSKTVS